MSCTNVLGELLPDGKRPDGNRVRPGLTWQWYRHGKTPRGESTSGSNVGLVGTFRRVSRNGPRQRLVAGGEDWLGDAAERADAARNRRVVLAAARTIMVNGGAAALCMDRVAAEAGVGVGTVYRRFGDRAGLAYALLDDEERRFQAALLFGPPPLGPGAPPAARLRAFLHAYVDRLDTHASLLALAEAQSPTARYGNGAYQTHRTHLVALLTLADAHTDATYLADALLAVLGGGLFLHQRQDLRFSTDRIKTGLDQLLTGLAPTPDPA